MYCSKNLFPRILFHNFRNFFGWHIYYILTKIYVNLLSHEVFKPTNKFIYSFHNDTWNNFSLKLLCMMVMVILCEAGWEHHNVQNLLSSMWDEMVVSWVLLTNTQGYTSICTHWFLLPSRERSVPVQSNCVPSWHGSWAADSSPRPKVSYSPWPKFKVIEMRMRCEPACSQVLHWMAAS